LFIDYSEDLKMSLFHLEKNAPQARNPASLCGVYWSARDMDNASPLGNHHFITFVYKNEAQADRLTKKWKALFPAIGYGMGFWTQQNEKKKPVYFSSMGFGRKDGNLSPNFNHKADSRPSERSLTPKIRPHGESLITTMKATVCPMHKQSLPILHLTLKKS